jgi:L-fuconolactonase
MIDAHQHFWSLARGDYAFPAPGDPVLYRDFLPADLEPILAAAGVSATVLVQATDTLEETGFLLEIAAGAPFVAGVVGWWDTRVTGLLDRLLALPGRETLVGVRPMLQHHDDVSWLVDSSGLADARRIADEGLVFDALVDARHLATIHDLCRDVPSLKVVIDHAGKPWRHPERWEAWMEDMKRIARMPNCWVKVSGFPFGARSAAAHSDPQRIVENLCAWFGTGRLVWGSDWPVVEREGGYRVSLDRLTALFGDDERDAVFRSNASALYGVRGP